MTTEEKKLYYRLQYLRKQKIELSEEDNATYRRLHREYEQKRLRDKTEEERQKYLAHRREQEKNKFNQLTQEEKELVLQKRRNAIKMCRANKSSEELRKFEEHRSAVRHAKNCESLKQAFNHKQMWTEDEVLFLFQNRDKFTIEQLAEKLGRTHFSVHSKLCDLRIRKNIN